VTAGPILSPRQLRAFQPEHRPVVEELARTIVSEIDRLLEREGRWERRAGRAQDNSAGAAVPADR
jgi:hypothetical protein